MRNNNFESVGEAIQKMLKTFNLKPRYDQTHLINSWERIVGKPIARMTTKLYFKNGVLYVKLDSPAVKNDFQLNKSHVLAVFKNEFGEDLIRDIVLL